MLWGETLQVAQSITPTLVLPLKGEENMKAVAF